MKALPLKGNDLKESDKFQWQIVAPPADNPDNLPYPTHEGKIVIGDQTIRCYQLNTGERIVNMEDVDRFFGLESKEDCSLAQDAKNK